MQLISSAATEHLLPSPLGISEMTAAVDILSPISEWRKRLLDYILFPIYWSIIESATADSLGEMTSLWIAGPLFRKKSNYGFDIQYTVLEFVNEN